MKTKRRIKRSARIEMLPLIDIVFLLLIFFIYAMLSMAVHRGLDLDLPESSQTTVSEKNHVSLSIKSAEPYPELYLNKERVELDRLRIELQNAVKEDPESPVLVFADEQVPYQQLFQVLDELQKAGITAVSLQANAAEN